GSSFSPPPRHATGGRRPRGPTWPASSPHSARARGSELGHRHTADEHQPHLAGAAEVDGGCGPIAHTLTGEHRAEAVFVVVDPIPGDQHQVRVALARRTEALGRPARADRPAPADAPTRGRVAAETAPGTETAA